jgi:hypothetical protein
VAAAVTGWRLAAVWTIGALILAGSLGVLLYSIVQDYRGHKHDWHDTP